MRRNKRKSQQQNMRVYAHTEVSHIVLFAKKIPRNLSCFLVHHSVRQWYMITQPLRAYQINDTCYAFIALHC